MTDDTATEERWAYAGQREAVKRGKLHHAWATDPDHPDEPFAHFAKVKGAVIGGVYAVRVVRDDGVSVHGRPVYTGERIDDTVVRTSWAADDAAHRTAVDMARRQAVDAKNDDFKDLCAPLRELVREQIGTTRRAGLIAAIIAEVSR